ncbi:MAG TPA: PAS domain S-box protein, partial [Gammaproteobacteria bacterium]|nr:PAS domain S-box protein [Gammaproteobacteria bacterium]
MRLFDQYFLQIPILVLCLLTGMINQANAEEILRLSDQKSDYPLAQYLTILEDPGGKLTLSEVTQPEMVKHFRKNREAGLNLGYSSRTFWLRLTVINRSNTDKRWLIQQNHTHTQLMEVYNQANNYRVQRSGTLVPLALRDVEQREITFTTKLPRNKEQTIYLRLQSHGAISLDINLLTQQAFINKKSKTIFVLGLFYGFLLIIAIYNLFFLLSLKELSHLYLVLFVFFFGAVYSLYDGFGQLFFNNAILSFAPYLMPILMGLTSITLLLHRNAFLSIDHPAGNDKFLLLGWLLLISATPFINLTYVMKATILLMLLTAAYIFVTTARCWHTQGSAVKFAVLGWAIFCGFIFLLGLARLNILPDYFIFEQFTRVGLIALVLLLSIALVDRMNKLKLNSDQVNAALIKAETHRNLALEAAQLGIWRWEIASDRIDWSDRTCQIFGVTPDNVPESFERYRTFIHPDDFDYLEKTVEEAIANHSPYSLQHRIIRKNGKEAWLQCYGKIELDEENNLLGITGTVQDISGQKQLEVEKKQSRQLYEAIFSSATEGFAICSFDGKILEANPAICDLYRYDKDTFL